MRSLTELIQKVAGGDLAARDELFAAAYSELRKLARSRLRDGGRNTVLETTALVHETYLKFVRSDAVAAGSREHFYRLAARAMRQVLLDDARIAGAAKRPHAGACQTLDEALPAAALAHEDLIDLDRAVSALEQIDTRLGEVAQLHLFAGLEFAEIAALRGDSERTVLRDWRKARAILVSRLEGHGA